MESFSEHLKRQREERKIKLSEVAVQTRISLKFLEAIEAGNFDILPKTYIRAFIRDYSTAIGLDPDETIRRFDLYLESLSSEKEKAETETETPQRGSQKSISLTGPQKIGAAAIGLVVLIVLSYLAFSPTKKQPAQLDGRREAQKVDQKNYRSPDRAPVAAKLDSAKLALSASDTVWVNLVVDDGRTYDLLMKPGTRLDFWGKKKFTMTIGNAGGLTISLNGHQYPPLGKPGVVIRNLTIYKDGTLKK